MSEDTDFVFQMIEPFNMNVRGAGLKEAALKVLEKHGRGASAEDAIAWCLRTMEPLFQKYEGLFAEVVPFYGALQDWALAGCPHFSLTPDFFSAVALTDFGDPTDEPLYMPFNAFTMSFPPIDLFHKATKLMVYRIPRVRTERMVVTEFNWKLYRVTLLKDNPIFSQWNIGMTRKQLVDEALSIDASMPKYGARPLDEDEKALPLRLRTVLANVMTYIESQGPLPTEARARKGAAPAGVERTHSDRPMYDVGRVIRLDGALRRAMQECAGDAARWHVAQRFVVRGHWRNQAHGEGRLLRRRQWIWPHYKGPENAVEAFTRSYEVK